uniref:Uncharacterized protein n=1 Tax=Chelydra serpentina TaxID=8475 RepID=A0A8C3RWP4_CHESE
MIKFWIIIRHLPNCTNHPRNLPSNTLFTRYFPSILINYPYHPRCTIRMTYLQHTRQRRLTLLHLYLPPHRPRTLLRVILI